MLKWVMRGLGKLFQVDMKLYLREPSGAFFTLVFPLMMLFLFGGLNGNTPHQEWGGYGMVDYSLPGYIALIIATTGLPALIITMAVARERGILRRLRATPLLPQAILTAQVLTLLVMTTVGVIILIVTARLVFHLRFAGDWFSVFVAFLLGSFSVFALGFVLAGFAPTARTGLMFSNLVFYPMIFLSGATIPIFLFPKWLQPYMKILPLYHVVSLVRGLWFGDPWSKHFSEVTILLAIIIGGVLVSAKTFRWE
jgi:ABC-2 type transport system permease protein